MNKKITILIVIIFILNIILNTCSGITLATESSRDTEKKNSESYWSTSNAPLFYGATKITIKKGLIDEFNVLDTRFRIFAKDFEDGDLTSQITYSGEVNVNEVGTYEIFYRVKDSHNNESTITVPVIITDNEDAKINVERTVYTIPSVWNMDIAGFSRCNYGDRQILGIYVPNGETLRARVISSDSNIAVNFLKNDSYQESGQNIPSNGEWITLQNTKEEESTGGSVPVLTSSVLKKENTDLTKTFQIELEYDTNIKELTYYHYQDDEEDFRSNWKACSDTYAVLENEVLTVIVPFSDIDRMTNYHQKGFTSLDQFLEYYQKVIEKMDEYVGLDLNPTNITDQNVRTKYLVKANAHGAGAAYYAGNHVGINSSSVSSFFEMNWGGLHELAHGYQGSLGKGTMGLGEVANNIIGHYIQIDKEVYFHNGDWLGQLKNIEENKNAGRLEGENFSQLDVSTKLYMIINLLDTFEGGTTYGKMFRWYRDQLNQGRTMTNPDAYVESLADLYHVNVIPYMEAWGLTISDTVKETVYSQNYPLLSILKDVTSQESLEQIMAGEKITEKYSLVTNDVLQKYNITGNVTLNIEIDDMEVLKGKLLQIKQNGTTIKSVKIEDTPIILEDLPVGTYYLQMPIQSNYSQNQSYLQVAEGDNTFTYTYENLEGTNYNSYLSLKLQGIYGTYGYELTFSDNYTKGKIHLNGSNMGNGTEAYVKIYDEAGNLVSEESTANMDGTIYFQNYNDSDYEIDLKPGYVIEVKHPNYANRVKMFSTLTGKELSQYRATTTITKYIVMEDGLRREDMEESEAQDISYSILKEYLLNIIKEYEDNVTEEELNNKFANYREKSNVINAYNHLNSEDQQPYHTLIARIRRGGIPIITETTENLDYIEGTDLDLYSLIGAMDNEDGMITINEKTTRITTTLDTNKPGVYNVTYQVSDSDNNVSTHTLAIKITENSEIKDPDSDPQPDEDPNLPEDQNPGQDIENPDDTKTPEEDTTPPSNDNSSSDNNEQQPNQNSNEGNTSSGSTSSSQNPNSNNTNNSTENSNSDSTKEGNNSNTELDSSASSDDVQNTAEKEDSTIFPGKLPQAGESIVTKTGMLLIAFVLITLSIFIRKKM